jgi:TRAP-type C4-dicarboxylate transport system permease small subunit
MRLLNALHAGADGVARLMALAIALLMFLEVMIRLFLPEYVLAWHEEVARSLLVYLTVVGGALALRDRTHFTMPMVIRLCSPRTRRRASLLGFALILLFSAVWLLASLPWVHRSANTFTPALQWDYRVIYAAFPIGALLMTISAGVLLVRQWRSAEPMELGRVDTESQVE